MRAVVTVDIARHGVAIAAIAVAAHKAEIVALIVAAKDLSGVLSYFPCPTGIEEHPVRRNVRTVADFMGVAAVYAESIIRISAHHLVADGVSDILAA